VQLLHSAVFIVHTLCYWQELFFLHVLLAQVLVQTGQVHYSTARFKIYLYHTDETRSVSVSGIYVTFLQFVAH
jgi:hypothetical protein